ncbi:MAG: hypothetical protein DMF95_00495, partial [Acidobacteria bacterium]
MKQRRGVFALLVLVMFASSIALFAQKKDDKKQDEAQKKEIQNIVKIVDDLTAGQPQGNKEYVPFTVSIDPSKLGGGNVAFYWRVVSKARAAPSAEPAAGQKKDDKKDKDKDKGKKPDYAYEDISFVPLAVGQNPMRISRSFTVPAGSYDVYLVAKEPTPDKAPKNAPAPKTSAIKQTVTVPDFWNNEFATSSVIIAQRIDPLAAPLTPQQQADRPYALGQMEILPTFDTKFTKKAELSTFMLIYNPKVDKDNKPDVSIEYNFYQKQSGAPEKFFN